jgi:hypothetical protein
MEERGIPTVMICTDEFSQLGRSEAASLGMPALPIALIPHPIGGQKPAAIQEKAEKVLAQAVQILTTPEADPMRQWSGQE